MKSAFRRIFCLAVIVGLLLSLQIIPSFAQDSTPPALKDQRYEEQSNRYLGLEQDADGLWFRPEGVQAPAATASTESLAAALYQGGPDNFGYTFTDPVAHSWISASSGTNTGVTNTNTMSGAIDIGFPFKYYENSYSKIYVARHGYANFEFNGNWTSQSRIPSAGPPNNVIAPHWAPHDNVNGYVRYLRGGSAPNRFFVVEWNRLTRDTTRLDEYTFGFVLYENGDIVFQYQGMPTPTSGYSCQASGIEDSTGTVGLSITPFCQLISSNHAVRIYRPAPAARVAFDHSFQGTFTHAGAENTFTINVRNIGELGADGYNAISMSSWPLALYESDGVTPLTDHDSDGSPDTGNIQQSQSKAVVVKMETPLGATVGSSNSAMLTFCSSKNPAVCRSVNLQTAVPAPFAQSVSDNGQVSQSLIQPAAQASKYLGYGWDTSVLELPNGNFLNTWTVGRCLDSNCERYANEILYTVVDKYGNTVRAATKLADLGGSPYPYNRDDAPAAAVAPDGSIGLLWSRYSEQYGDNTYGYNYNLFFAVLDSQGKFKYGPANLTNNTTFGDYFTVGLPRYYKTSLSATGDNRFVLVWDGSQRAANCSSGDCWLDDVYYSTRTSNGSQLSGATKFTNDVAGSNQWESFDSSSVAALANNRALITYTRGSDSSIMYAVINSSGGVVKDKTKLAPNAYGYGSDAAQLSDGSIVIAWNYNRDEILTIRFIGLNSSYNPVTTTIPLDHLAASAGAENVSVTTDKNGRAVLTWMDSYNGAQKYLYYALVNGSGSVLTSPMVFYTSRSTFPYATVSTNGMGNTTYSSEINSGVDSAVWPAQPVAFASPGMAATVDVHYTNYGQQDATGVKITAELDANLIFAGDSEGMIPTISGNTVEWELDDLKFLEQKSFRFYLFTPTDDEVGTSYPVTLTIQSAETDSAQQNNTAAVTVVKARQVFLPLINR